MIEEKVTEVLNDCVNLKILRRVDDNLGIDQEFHDFYSKNIESVVLNIPEIVMNKDKNENKAFMTALAAIIVGYTKITDPQRVLDLVLVSNKIFKALKVYENLGDVDGK